MTVKQFGLLVMVIVSLSACSSSSNPASAGPDIDIPDWVVNPYVAGGVSATDCVEYSGNIFNDQKMAVANANQVLAKRLASQVVKLDKAYASLGDNDTQKRPEATFSSTSQQLIQQHLAASRVLKADIIAIAGKDYFCALTTLPSEQSKSLFKALINSSQIVLAPDEQKALYQEFKAYKIETDRNKEITRLTK
ncbi:hypothetical protein [Pseudoalteromonas 'SMAR']|uniref:hypothetical protein n=1 Tax=Pseudoalteromonas 'SMAR' TaxID=3416908 RepID=UPI003AF27D8F